MALITADRVKEITRTTGTGSFSLEGTSTGYRAFENVCANNDTCYYCVVSQSGSEWEIGLGTFKTVNTLERTTVHSSSNAGALVNFSAGTKDIFLAITASQFTGSTLPAQTGNSGKFLTTNGTTASWSDNPLGTVTQVTGNGTVNGLSLTGNVTSSGNITLGGTLSGVNLGTQVTGTLPVVNGGTGQTTQQAAINTLAGASTSGYYLRGNGSNVTMAAIQAADVPTLNQNTTGTATNVTGTVAVINGGTGTTTGSITGTGALTFAAGGSNQNVTISPSGTGTVLIDGITVGEVGSTVNPSLALGNGALASANSAATYPVARAIAIGKSALGNFSSHLGSSTDGLIAIGENAIGNPSSLVVTGSVAIGSNAFFKGGTSSVSIGGRAGYEGGSGLVAIGHSASRECVGYNVVSIGYVAGAYQADGVTSLTASENSVYIGYYTCGFNNNDVNAIVIGSRSIGKGTNSTVIGTTSTNAAYIYCNTLNLGNGASSATITANGALTVNAGGTNQDVTLTPSGTGKVNAPAIKETVFAITDGSSVDINPANGGIQTWTLGANRTPTASSFAEGQSVTLMIDDGTAYAITWSSISPTWVGGSAPTLATSGYTVIEFWKRSTTIYGALVGTA